MDRPEWKTPHHPQPLCLCPNQETHTSALGPCRCTPPECSRPLYPNSPCVRAFPQAHTFTHTCIFTATDRDLQSCASPTMHAHGPGTDTSSAPKPLARIDCHVRFHSNRPECVRLWHDALWKDQFCRPGGQRAAQGLKVGGHDAQGDDQHQQVPICVGQGAGHCLTFQFLSRTQRKQVCA